MSYDWLLYIANQVATDTLWYAFLYTQSPNWLFFDIISWHEGHRNYTLWMMDSKFPTGDFLSGWRSDKTIKKKISVDIMNKKWEKKVKNPVS